jgi:protein O-mannosyl-transferase
MRSFALAIVKTASASPKNRDWVWGALLLVVTLLAYAPAWNGQPLWDDAAHMTKPELRSAAGLADIWMRLGATQQYYPLVHSVFWLQQRLWGQWTVGYHLLNILLHGLSALLLVRILRKLEIRGAWLAGWIFALHPVMVESIAWITELKNTLSGVLYLAAALAYVKFDDRRQTRHYVAAALFFALGLLSKSVIATLPAVLLVVFWWMRGRISWKRDVLPLLPFLGAGMVSGLFTAWVERRFIGATGAAFNFNPIERCLIAGRALWFYLFKLLWPANLIFIYPRWHIDSTVLWQYLLPTAILLLTVLSWVLRRRSRTPLAVLLCFAMTLFPALGFFNVYPFLYSFVADHFQYLASIGPIAVGAAGISRGTDYLSDRHWRPLQPFLHGGLLSLLFALSWSQSRMYADAETLYRTTIAKNDDCWMAHTHLGLLLMESARYDEATIHLLKASRLHPDPAAAENNLGLLFMDMGRTEEAKSHLLQALKLDPNQADAHNNLGALLARNGQPDQAMPHLLRALQLHPDHAEVQYNLGDLLADTGRADEALVHYQKALELYPDYADAHNNLGRLLANRGSTAEAIAHFRRAVALNPNHANAQNNLGVMLAQSGKTDEAIEHYRKAVEIDPAEMSHLDNLVVALVKRGQWREAMSVLRHALTLAKSTADDVRVTTIEQSLARLAGAVDAARGAWERPSR